MRELTVAETEHAAGGLGAAATLGLSLAAAYAYEKLGGAKGIEKKVKAALDFVVEGALRHAEACNKAPAACMPTG